MKSKLGKLAVVAAVLVCFFILQVPAAKADTIIYTFTGSAELAGTDFTYVSTGGYLSYGSAQLTPTTATDVVFFAADFGPITSVIFKSSTAIDINPGITLEPLLLPYDIGAAGSYPIKVLFGQEGPVVFGNLVVEDIASVATPEPSTVILLAAGLVGLLILARRNMPLVAG